MTAIEFSNEFDTLLSSYSHSISFGESSSQLDMVFDEYEKSIFLTQAFKDIVNELYSGTASGESFETSEEIRRKLDFLVSSKVYTPVSNKDFIFGYKKWTYTLPDDTMYIIYERVEYGKSTNKCISNKSVDVRPVTHDELNRLLKNPFKGPNENRVIRIDSGSREVELISKYDIGSYTIKYIKYPYPIILTDLTISDLEIDGDNKVTSSKNLDDLQLIKRDILERAVRLAVISKSISNNTQKRD